MKKIISLCIIMFLLAICVDSYAAAGSTVIGSDVIVPLKGDYRNVGKVKNSRVIVISCIAGSAGEGFVDITLNIANGLDQSLIGWSLWKIKAINTSSEADLTADCDVTLKISNDDLLNGGGTDNVDSDVQHDISPLDINGNFSPSVVYSDPVLSTAGNSENSSILTYVIELR